MIFDSDGNSYENLTSWHLNSPSQATEDKQSSDESKKIYFVRHGETDLNKESGEHSSDQPVRGWSNVPLNQQGIKEAQKAANSVKDLPIEHIVASDLPRAKQTANIIGNRLGITPEFDPGLRTWNLGEHTGKAGKEVHDEVDRLCTTAQDERPKGGESFNEFKNRILGTMSNIVQRHSDKELLIVSHNSPERILHAWTEAGQPQKQQLPGEMYSYPPSKYKGNVNSPIREPEEFDYIQPEGTKLEDWFKTLTPDQQKDILNKGFDEGPVKGGGYGFKTKKPVEMM